VRQPRNRGKAFLIQGVFNPSFIRKFSNVRNTLTVDGITLVLDQAEIIWIDAHGILICDAFNLSRVGFERYRKITFGDHTLGKKALP
jgi:hypothetical protein